MNSFHQKIFDGFLDRLSAVPEGRALAAFAREKKIGFEIAPMSGGQWVLAENKMKMGGGVGFDQAVGIVAHELRHAWQDYNVPKLKNVQKKTTGGTARKVTLLRGMEADAFSFQLALLVALKKEGVVSNVAAAMMDKRNPIDPHFVKEVQGFAKDFEKKHGDSPFSAAARREAFDFFQSSDYFKVWYDSAFEAHFYRAGKGAAPAELPTLSQTFSVFSRNTLSKGGGRYLSADEARGMEAYTLAKLAPDLKTRLSR